MRARFLRTSLADGQNEASYPTDVSLLSTQAVMLEPQHEFDLVWQTRWLLQLRLARYIRVSAGVSHYAFV
jgi:hypothetical protein